MTAGDVTDVELALATSGRDQMRVRHKSRLLSDNGPSYIGADLADWLNDRKIEHIRGAP
jgi:transposase InsO family protein